MPTKIPKLLVSSCLLGNPVRYDGKHNFHKVQGHTPLASYLHQWQMQSRIIPICPETLGGLPTPRPAAEIITQTGHLDGHHVLTGHTRVLTQNNQDVSEYFLQGAYKTLELALEHKVVAALLVAKSPSCGVGAIYDGHFSRHMVRGDGVTAALLKQHGIACFTLNDYRGLLQLMRADQP